MPYAQIFLKQTLRRLHLPRLHLMKEAYVYLSFLHIGK